MGYQKRIPSHLRTCITPRCEEFCENEDPEIRELRNNALIASEYGYWSQLRHCVEYALKHFRPRFAECIPDTVQANIVISGNLRMLKWSCNAMLGICERPIMKAGRYGNLELLEYMQVHSGFWPRIDVRIDLGDRHWLIHAAENSHLDILDWASRNRIPALNILDLTFRYASDKTLAWCLNRLGAAWYTNPKALDYLERCARRYMVFFILAWLQRNFNRPVLGTLFINHVFRGNFGTFGRLVKQVVEYKIRIEWTECCLHRFNNGLRQMCIYVFNEVQLAQCLEAFEIMVELLLMAGAATSCEKHPIPINMEEYKAYLTEQGRKCIKGNTPREGDSYVREVMDPLEPEPYEEEEFRYEGLENEIQPWEEGNEGWGNEDDEGNNADGAGPEAS